MTNRDWLKQFVGKDIYGIGTGNNARRGDNTRVERFRVVKVAIKKITLQNIWESGELGREFTYTMGEDIGDVYSDWNSGYRLFETEQDVSDHFERIRLLREFRETFYSTCQDRGYTLDQLRRVKEILDENKK